MASNINPNIIDGSYPVAGQDNSSQGFRDNFTNIKTNFQAAENEINELESKAILKSALGGQTLDNNMGNSLLVAAKIQDFSATKVSIAPATGAVTINYAAGHYQTVTTTGSISLSFSNLPETGSYGWVRVQITVSSTAHTVTLPAAVSLGLDGIQGISPGLSGVSNVITFAAAGVYEFEFTTSNAGTTITVFDLNSVPLEYFVVLSSDYTASNSATAQQVFNASSAGAVTLSPSTTYFMEAQYIVTRSAGTTAHTVGVLFGTSGTLTSIAYTAEVTDTSSNTLGAVSRIYSTTAAETVITASSADASQYITVKISGVVRTNSGGTFTPQLKYSAAPGGAPTVLTNSYFRIKPVGTNTITTAGTWS
jgi:hypothetical protein